MILGIKTTHKLGVEVYTSQHGQIAHHTFPELQSDALMEAVDSVVRPDELSGIIVLEGPGSFTAVRSAAVTGNTLAAALGVPLVAAVSMEDGIQKLAAGANGFPIAPHYDREPNITKAIHHP